jgi:hypothetical protein
MLNKLYSLSFVLASAVALTGCTDPIVGDWEADNDCGDSEMTANDDGTGDGEIWMVTGAGCTLCKFEFDWEEAGDGKYDAELEFDECHCDGEKKGDADCTMNDAEDEMDCDLTIGICDFDEQEWKKKE